MHYKEISVPYRVCPLGAHIDHQHGIVTGFALDMGVRLVFTSSENSRVCVKSRNFDGITEFDVSAVPQKKGFWGDYVSAALWSLQNSGYVITKGFTGEIEGQMSEGGLSSSAAVILSYITAFCQCNNITIGQKEIISLSHKAETQYIGLNCGVLDQSCEVLCKKDCLLVLDTHSGSFRNVKKNSRMPDFEIGIFFSGLTRSLVSSDYNKRTGELLSACKKIGEHSDSDSVYTVLRDIPYDVYKKYSSFLTEEENKRCTHYYTEMQRVYDGVTAFENGDLAAFGKYINQSGQSSVENYEAGCEEITALYNILRNTDGVYGARFSGAGFKGCCMAIINPDYKQSIKETVTKSYTEKFPEVSDNFKIFFCKTHGGIVL